MTSIISAGAASVLRVLITKWCSDYVSASNLQGAELSAEAVQKICGQVVLEVSLSSQCGKSSKRGAHIKCTCGGKAPFEGYRNRWVRSASGEVVVNRAYYRCSACKIGRFPWDEEQGLTTKVSTPRLKASVCHVMGLVPYSPGVQLLESLIGVRIEESTSEDIVDEVGKRIRVEQDEKLEAVKQDLLERAKAPYMLSDVDFAPNKGIERRPVKGNRVYIAIDAATAHIDKEWHNVQHGIVFNVIQDENGKDKLSEREYVAGQMDMPKLGWCLRSVAESWNSSLYNERIFLGDGAPCNWTIAAEHFPDAIPILDFFHASEHICALARTLYSQSDVKQKAKGVRWRDERIKSLKHKGPKPLLRSLKMRKGLTAEAREAVRKEIGYFTKNTERMDYPTHIAKGRVIGSGSIEAACKSITCVRLKGTGMRWSAPGADAIIAVRTTILNGNSKQLEDIARAA